MIASLTLALLLTGTDQAALHAAASSTCAAFKLRSTGTIHYFCDCQAGAQAGCVAGDDQNLGTTPGAPKQTWAAANALFGTMPGGDTIALCRGGVFSVTNASYCQNQWSNTSCAAGTSLTDPANTSTCDIRDYSPPWGGTNKPVLYAGGTGYTGIIQHWGSTTNGVRIFNLEFRGANLGPNGGRYYRSVGIWGGSCGPGTEADWLVCNNTFTHLMMGISNTTNAALPLRWNIWGNRFLMNDLDAILGSPGTDGKIDANFFDDNGSFTPHPLSGNQAHVLYLAEAKQVRDSRVRVVNNEIRRSGAGATSPGPCGAVVFESHALFEDLVVENNVIDAGADALGSCYGVSFENNVSDEYWTSYKNLRFRGNWIHGGGAGLAIGQDPGAIIENNVVVLDTKASPWMIAMNPTLNRARAGQDPVADGVTVRNNTIFMTAGAPANYGILVDTEGTGHVIANNAVYAANLTHCFETPLASTAYAFIGNNACYLGTWGTTFDATAHLTADPLFVSPPGDFSLQPLSPLRGAGDPAHAPAVDFQGAARPATPSIGAYDVGGGGSGSSGGGSSSSGGPTGGGGGSRAGCGTSGELPGALGGLALLALALRRRRSQP